MATETEINASIKESPAKTTDRVEEFKRRMLAWSNPVEFVNNMYGSHPDDDGGEYFKSVFRK